MPHLNIEYSSNLEARVPMDDFCEAMLRAALATGVFETGAVRVRATMCSSFAIADDHPDNAFLDMSLRIGAGRDLETKKRAGEAIFAAARAYLSDLFNTPHFALSFEIREIDRDLSWRINVIHPRLRGR